MYATLIVSSFLLALPSVLAAPAPKEIVRLQYFYPKAADSTDQISARRSNHPNYFVGEDEMTLGKCYDLSEKQGNDRVKRIEVSHIAEILTSVCILTDMGFTSGFEWQLQVL